MISRFLGVSRRTVRNALLYYGIAEPQASPFNTTGSSSLNFPGLGDGSSSELDNHNIRQSIDLSSFDSAISLDIEDPI